MDGDWAYGCWNAGIVLPVSLSKEVREHRFAIQLVRKFVIDISITRIVALFGTQRGYLFLFGLYLRSRLPPALLAVGSLPSILSPWKPALPPSRSFL